MDHIAHQGGLDGETFHLTDPNPLTVGQLIKVLTKVAHAPSPVANIGLPIFRVANPIIRSAFRVAPPAKMAC